MTQTLKLSPTEINLLLTAAGRAPSGGNIQPWLVHLTGPQLIIKLNPQKLGTILDVNNYGSLFALGSFCQNFEITALHLGLQFDRQIINPQNPNLFQIKYTLLTKNNPKKHPLYPAVLNRDTNRQLCEGKLIPETTISQLKSLVTKSDKNYKLYTISTYDQKSALAKILGKADLIRTKNTVLLKQLLSELRWTDSEVINTKDGLDINTMELPGNVAKMLHLLSKFPAMAKTVPDIAFEKQAWPMLKNSSHLCVLSINQPPNPLNVFQAGFINQHLWLHTTSLGLAFHPWTVLSFFVIRAKYFKSSAFSPSEEKLLLDCDNQLKKMLNMPKNHTPIFIFRLSFAKPPSARSLRYTWKKYTTLSPD